MLRFFGRIILLPILLGLLSLCATAAGQAANAASGPPIINNAQLAAAARAEEKRLNAQIGAAVLDGKGQVIAQYRGGERFPLNSTHKPLLCAALLAKAARGELNLSDKIRFGKRQLVEYSPITQNFTAPKAMDWRHLCAAAIEDSDNGAANLISEKLGGPAQLTRFLRGLGDRVTQLDRFEPQLNSAKLGDKRDITSPIAIGQTLRKLLLTHILPPAARAQLIQWMRNDKVADALLRAALPPQWQIADKSGAGAHGSRSIIAAVWPKPPLPAAAADGGRGAAEAANSAQSAMAEPLIITIYISNTRASMTERNAAIARLGGAIFTAAQKRQTALPADKSNAH